MTRPRLSASQIDSYLMCQRKWAWRYIAGLRPPPNKYAARGSAVHKVLEQYLLHATPPDRNTEAGAIALPGLKYLPEPGRSIVEEKFDWSLPDEPFDLTGVIDWVVPPAIGELSFGDHKTSSNFAFAKTAEDLRQDVQATLYAYYLMLREGIHQIKGRWVYYHANRPYRAKCVDWQTDLSTALPSFKRVLEAGREMAQWHQQKPEMEDVPINADACDAFGGCPFRENCNLSSRERLVSLMAQGSLREKMERRKAANTAEQRPTSVCPAVSEPVPGLAPQTGVPQSSAAPNLEPASAPLQQSTPAPSPAVPINPPENPRTQAMREAYARSGDTTPSLTERMRARKQAQAALSAFCGQII